MPKQPDEHSKRTGEMYADYLERQPYGSAEVEISFIIRCPHCDLSQDADLGRVRFGLSEMGDAGAIMSCDWCHRPFKHPAIPEGIPREYPEGSQG